MRRRLFSLSLGGARLFGTHHLGERGARTGLLLINFGYVPRDGHGGLAVKLADRLASVGFPSFRVDLPALGDSEGELPRDSARWFDEVRAGALADVTLGAARAIADEHGLEGVVIGGLCAASITAIYACARERERRVAGLLLLEPEMFTAETSASQEGAPGSWRKALSYWSWARVVTGESRYARYLPVPRSLLGPLLAAQRSKLPPSTNLALVAAWQSVVRSRRPALVVTAEGKMRELFLERVNRVAVPGYPPAWIAHERVPRTNHIFTTGGAIAKVTELASRWFARTFTM